MKIVFMETDTVGKDISFEAFEKLGEVVTYPLSSPGENAERIKDADIIVANKILMNGQLLAGAEKARLICLTATGTNNVDFAYTDKRGIAVANVSGYSTHSVVQHTFAMLFYLYEKLAYYDEYVKSGKYCDSPVFSHFEEHFNELYGKTFGIIGLGEIGRGVASVARAFGCRVVYYSTSGKNNNPEYERIDTFDEFLSQADIVSVHAPLNEKTQNLLNAEAFKQMKPTAYLLNLGRGPIVNQADLAEALERGELAGAALDVLETEPVLRDDSLLRLKDSKRLLITPHIAWATVEARNRCVSEVYKNIEAFLKGERRNRVDSL